MNDKPQEISLKPQGNKSVLLIAKDEGLVSQITDAITDLPKHDLDAQTGTLAGMNGTAVDFARSNDLVIFETQTDQEDDLRAMAALKAELDQQVKIIAVTKEDISLAHARLITRAGADDVLTYPFDLDDLRDQVTRLTTPNSLVVVQQPTGSAAPAPVVAVAKSRGGAGSTTVAVNLAHQLQGKSGWGRKTTSRVLIIDLDLQFGAVSTFLDVEPSDAQMTTEPAVIAAFKKEIEGELDGAPGGNILLVSHSNIAPLYGAYADEGEEEVPSGFLYIVSPEDWTAKGRIFVGATGMSLKVTMEMTE